MNFTRKYLRTAIDLASRNEELAITAIITKLEIIIIFIRKSDILCKGSRESILKLLN